MIFPINLWGIRLLPVPSSQPADGMRLSSVISSGNPSDRSTADVLAAGSRPDLRYGDAAAGASRSFTKPCTAARCAPSRRAGDGSDVATTTIAADGTTKMNCPP